MDTSYYNRFGDEELTRRLSSETLLAQGPMGSVLLSEYDAADIPPAFWNLAEPQTVSRIHRLYVAAGAQVGALKEQEGMAQVVDLFLRPFFDKVLTEHLGERFVASLTRELDLV